MELKFDNEDLAPLIRTVLAEVLKQLPLNDGREGYSEAEVAEMLGVKPHVIRDERLRGRIEGTRVGGSVRFTKPQILKYLATNPWTGRGAD